MLGDDPVQTEKGKLNQRVCCALFKFRMCFNTFATSGFRVKTRFLACRDNCVTRQAIATELFKPSRLGKSSSLQ